MSDIQGCGCCGMLTDTPREYHPWAACELFSSVHSPTQVHANIKSVIEYGMKAQRVGVTADEAMADFNLVLGFDVVRQCRKFAEEEEDESSWRNRNL